jgi:hypothetical protein
MKTCTIHSYFVSKTGINTLTMPEGARIVSLLPSSKGIRVNAWHKEASDDAPLPAVQRFFYLTRTGVPMPAEAMTEGTFLGSFRGGAHLIEVTKQTAQDISDLYPTLEEVSPTSDAAGE